MGLSVSTRCCCLLASVLVASLFEAFMISHILFIFLMFYICPSLSGGSLLSTFAACPFLSGGSILPFPIGWHFDLVPASPSPGGSSSLPFPTGWLFFFVETLPLPIGWLFIAICPSLSGGPLILCLPLPLRVAPQACLSLSGGSLLPCRAILDIFGYWL